MMLTQVFSSSFGRSLTTPLLNESTLCLLVDLRLRIELSLKLCLLLSVLTIERQRNKTEIKSFLREFEKSGFTNEQHQGGRKSNYGKVHQEGVWLIQRF